MIPKRFSARLRNRITQRTERSSTPESVPGIPNSVEQEQSPTPVKNASREIDLSNANDQSQCPLFSKIPPEIRNEIFYLALQEYTDRSKSYERQTFYTRPGFEGEKRVDVALLRTCKRVYEETKVLPLRGLEVVFYLGQKPRAARDYIAAGHEIYAQPYTRSFTPEHWSRINSVHVFAQMYAVRPGLLAAFSGKRSTLAPSRLTVTLRYTDWYWWEHDRSIYPIQSHQFFDMNAIQLPDSITKVVVQFEYAEARVRQLESVVGEMFKRRDWWYWRRRDGRKLVVKGENAVEKGAVREWKWTGPTRFSNGGNGGQRFAHHGTGEEMGYVVKEVTWELGKDEEA